MEIKHKYKLGEWVMYNKKLGRISMIKASTTRSHGHSKINENAQVVYYLKDVNEWVQEEFLTQKYE